MDDKENTIMFEQSMSERIPEKEHRVGYQLKALDHMFRRHMQAMMRQNAFEGMSMMNGYIIGYLAKHEHEDIFQKDIEKEFKIGKSSIAGTIKMMEEKGFIIRKAVENDARLKKVCLTDKGRGYIEKMEQGRLYMEQKVCKGISEEELSLFFQTVQKMQTNLQK